MPPKLTPQQELDTAFARNQAGTASVEDMKNIAYAKRTQGYTPTAPSVPTVQQIYGEPVAKTPLQLSEDRNPTPSITPTSNLTPNVNNPLNAVYKEYEEGLNTGFAVDENKIQNDTLAQFQQQIDATNKVYADMLAKEVQASRGRTGQDTAIQARRGMLGSDFGAAQAATVERGNIEQQNYVENQRLAAISKILTQAKTDATARIAEEKALKKASLEDKIAYYKSAAERRETNASKAAQALLAQGLDLTKVTPLELSRLTQYYNVDKEDIEMAFNLVKQQQEQANAAANIKDAKVLEEGEILVGADGKIIATGTTGGQTVTLNEGQIVYKIGPNGEYIPVAQGGQKAKSQPQSVQEYEYYVSQELAANREPVSYDEYQTIDTNRKRSIASAGSSSGIAGTPTSYKEWVLAGSPGSYSEYLQNSNVKAPTVAQQTVATYAARLEQATPIIDKLENTLKDMNVVKFEAEKRLPSYLQSAEYQQFDQASRNFINAVLRRESGAVISPSEFDNAYKQYLPKPGDSAGVLQQKKANRDVVFSSFRKAAGSAYSPVSELLEASQQTTPTTQSASDILSEYGINP